MSWELPSRTARCSHPKAASRMEIKNTHTCLILCCFYGKSAEEVIAVTQGWELRLTSEITLILYFDGAAFLENTLDASLLLSA